MKACPRCGVTLCREMFRDLYEFNRARYCSKACWNESRRTSTVKVTEQSAWIQFRDGRIAQIGPEDAIWISKQTWCISSHGYVQASKGKRLHQQILGKLGAGLVADHINRDRLDNRRENLRVVTHQQNALNREPRRNQSGEIGIYLKRKGQWYAQLGKRHIGSYASIEAAKRAREERLALVWAGREECSR
jgi:hypothetical protein